MAETDVTVREVGLRDGIQIIGGFMPTPAKIAWVEAEVAAGVSEIEVTSFVPPAVIAQFADAPEVAAAAVRLPGLETAALVPNLKGAERAVAAGVGKINFVMSVSRTHNLNNVRREREESLADFRRIAAMLVALPPERRPMLVGGLSTAFGCSFEGPVPADAVRHYATLLAEAGAQELIIADTVGYGDPAQVRVVFDALRTDLGALPLAAHFHDTRGTGLANVAAALDCGVRRFDASLGGLGGCPFAPGATGNIVMEDLCFMLDSMGLRTGVDLEALLAVRRQVAAALPGEAMYGALARAGLPKRYVSAEQRRAEAGPAV
ncbi:hydroxymethylglutaryl-CoA lyase [Roseomonas sp. E05]|uniref:hydroxymethylglutaryl-CoA lyase n=1 Tax=Roseomonas sp. E05 TaxID=3046310 RepID=UPI0024BAE852|nr:hydroxymethylglutaryl-CoA lyase [Roseomonas sp. E05]MDJ0390546.1 hydroxymethylglutaryl-CoA lyase [Roseomonas sp. E05]